MTLENEKLEALQGSSSLTGLSQGVNAIVGNALGLSMVLVVFVISFYRLSDQGYVPAFAASSFTSTILAFALASASILPAEMPFIIAALSVASTGYMYINQRA